MPDSGAPLKMNVRPSARKIRGIQQTSERLIGFLEWGADFILALARDASLLARDDGRTLKGYRRASVPKTVLGQ